MKERTNTSRLFELFAKFVQGLTDQEITEFDTKKALTNSQENLEIPNKKIILTIYLL